MLSPRSVWLGGLTILLATCSLAAGIHKEKKPPSPCGQPPQLVPGPKVSKEEQRTRYRERVQGVIAVAINEEGEVVEVRVVRASSKEAATLLVNRVKSMKFKPRPGCGVYKTEVSFTLSD